MLLRTGHHQGTWRIDKPPVWEKLVDYLAILHLGLLLVHVPKLGPRIVLRTPGYVEHPWPVAGHRTHTALLEVCIQFQQPSPPQRQLGSLDGVRSLAKEHVDSHARLGQCSVQPSCLS